MTQARDVVARFESHCVDITEQVRMMYDALINSMDWGSEFLDTDTKGAILAVGVLIGAEIPSSPGREYNYLTKSGFTELAPVRSGKAADNRIPYDKNPDFQKWFDDYTSWNRRKDEHLRKWMSEFAAQEAAKLRLV